MATASRSVPAGRGWVWIVEGFALFRKSPGAWILLLLVLLALAKVPLAALVQLNAPRLAIVFLLLGVLLAPVFIAGFMEGCRALENGRPLQPAYLLSGFFRNAAQLVTIGGAWVLANLLVSNVISSVSGEAMATIVNMVSQKQQIEPQVARDAQQIIGRAAMLGVIISIPCLMALCYASPLVYFQNETAIGAMKASFVACLKNAGPLLIYGLVMMLGMFLATPFGMALGQYDLALWLLAPILLPSLYVSYKDVFLVDTATVS